MGIEDIPIIAIYIFLLYLPTLYLSWRLLRLDTLSKAIAYSLIAVVAVSTFFFPGIISLVSYPCLAILLSLPLSRAITSTRLVVLVGFILSSLVGGIVVVLFWPLELVIHFNMLGTLLADEIHDLVVAKLGEPHSPYASLTIPLVFRYPFVEIIGSLTAWVLVGIILVLVVPLRIFNKLLGREHST